MESELRQIQQKCLEILDLVIDICQKYNIKYSLCGGSAVGAHLYQGILPWDDDIDLMMTREHYNRFLQVAEHELPAGFSIHNYQNSDLSNELFFCWTKIFNDNTTLVQTNGKKEGIFLDIAVYDRVPEGMLKYVVMFLYRRVMMVNWGKKPGNGLKNIIRNWVINSFLKKKEVVDATPEDYRILWETDFTLHLQGAVQPILLCQHDTLLRKNLRKLYDDSL